MYNKQFKFQIMNYKYRQCILFIYIIWVFFPLNVVCALRKQHLYPVFRNELSDNVDIWGKTGTSSEAVLPHDVIKWTTARTQDGQWNPDHPVHPLKNSPSPPNHPTLLLTSPLAGVVNDGDFSTSKAILDVKKFDFLSTFLFGNRGLPTGIKSSYNKRISPTSDTISKSKNLSSIDLTRNVESESQNSVNNLKSISDRKISREVTHDAKISNKRLRFRRNSKTGVNSSRTFQSVEDAKDFGGRNMDVSSEFSRYSVVTPSLVHTRSKRAVSHTLQEDGISHVHHVTVGIHLNGNDTLLDLQLNRNLISDKFHWRVFRNQSHSTYKPKTEEVDMCHYQGSIPGVLGSWAAVSTCNGIRGVVFDGENTHFLEPIPGVTMTHKDPHYVLDFRDMLKTNLTCGYKGHPLRPPEKAFKDPPERKSRSKRYVDTSSSTSASSSSTIRGPFNSNAMSRYVELVLVADHAEFEKQGSDLSKIHDRFKSIANIVNALYQPLNIFVALVGVEVWEDGDPVEVSTDGDEALTNFLNYRKVRLIPVMSNDNAQLLTGRAFDSGVVGKALKGPICTYQYSGGVNMDHSESVGLVATTVAHEMGHNFGMEHDTEEECQCPDKRCIMAPSSGVRSPSHWSSCSHEYLAISFERSMDYCLRNRPTSLFDSPVCGNGFMESGEQCDCGLPEYCDNPCCDPNTCKLFSNATCATGHCCDLETCRPKPAGTECRTAVEECDLPEYCSGDGEFCPNDFYKQDGESCERGKAFCYSGKCRTHDLQCSLLWGPTGKNSDDKCYQLNREGNTNGNCGYDWANKTYQRCNYEDIKCGMIHCKHLNERLEFGMESVSKVSHRFIADGDQRIIPCRVAQVDLGLDMMDPGLVPDGAKCGYNKMCVDQRCLPVSSLRLYDCDCNDRGVCNNLGHCHCDVGFTWPNCLYPGLGGSEDSGPASNPNATNGFVVVMFVFFLGVVPFVAVILCLVYYGPENVKRWWISKGRLATSRLSHKDSQQRPHQSPSSGPPPSNKKQGTKCSSVASAFSRVRSDSPRSSSGGGSKSNSPLLNSQPESSQETAVVQSQLFGKFEGFTLSPIKERAKVATGSTPSKDLGSNGDGSSGSGISLKSKPNPLPSNVWPPASSKATSLDISGPSLQTSTNPAVKGSSGPVPLRAAPPPPAVTNTPTANDPQNASSSRPKSVPDVSVLMLNEPPPSSVSFELNKDQTKRSAVSRIASFLNKKEKGAPLANAGETVLVTSHSSSQSSNTLPRKASKINRENLVNLEISHPMQLQATELPSNLVPVRSAPEPPMTNNVKPSEVKATTQTKFPSSVKVSWAVPSHDTTAGDVELKETDSFSRIGSVREPSVTSRPVIPKFGSMRTPRPKSLPPARPSQPPPRPPLPAIPATPETEYFYDDCITVQFSSGSKKTPSSSPQESIYATIDEDSPMSDYPKQEVFSSSSDLKKGKKGFLSMLYAKAKKRTHHNEAANSDPVYCNVDESINSPVETTGGKLDSPQRYPTVMNDGSNMGVGNSEEGSLLSEIVSELTSREPQYMNTLSSEEKDEQGCSIIKSTTAVIGKPNLNSSSVSKPLFSTGNKTSVQVRDDAMTHDDAASSYSSSPNPRGVFSFFKNNSSSEMNKNPPSVENVPGSKAAVLKWSSGDYNSASNAGNRLTDKVEKGSLLKDSLASVKSASAEAKIGFKKNEKIGPKNTSGTASKNVSGTDLKYTSGADKLLSKKVAPTTSSYSTPTSTSKPSVLSSGSAGVPNVSFTNKVSNSRPSFPPDKVLSPDNSSSSKNNIPVVHQKTTLFNDPKSSSSKIATSTSMKPISSKNSSSTSNNNNSKGLNNSANSDVKGLKPAISSNVKSSFEIDKKLPTSSATNFSKSPSITYNKVNGEKSSVNTKKSGATTSLNYSGSSSANKATLSNSKPAVTKIDENSSAKSTLKNKVNKTASQSSESGLIGGAGAVSAASASSSKSQAPPTSKSDVRKTSALKPTLPTTSSVATLQQKFEKVGGSRDTKMGGSTRFAPPRKASSGRGRPPPK